LESWTLTTQLYHPGSPAIEPAIDVEHGHQDAASKHYVMAKEYAPSVVEI
jgi:hypothetical protein